MPKKASKAKLQSKGKLRLDEESEEILMKLLLWLDDKDETINGSHSEASSTDSNTQLLINDENSLLAQLNNIDLSSNESLTAITKMIRDEKYNSRQYQQKKSDEKARKKDLARERWLATMQESENRSVASPTKVAVEESTPESEPTSSRVRVEVISRQNHLLASDASVDGPLPINHKIEIAGSSTSSSSSSATAKVKKVMVLTRDSQFNHTIKLIMDKIKCKGSNSKGVYMLLHLKSRMIVTKSNFSEFMRSVVADGDAIELIRSSSKQLKIIQASNSPTSSAVPIVLGTDPETMGVATACVDADTEASHCVDAIDVNSNSELHVIGEDVAENECNSVSSSENDDCSESNSSDSTSNGSGECFSDQSDSEEEQPAVDVSLPVLEEALTGNAQSVYSILREQQQETARFVSSMFSTSKSTQYSGYKNELLKTLLEEQQKLESIRSGDNNLSNEYISSSSTRTNVQEIFRLQQKLPVYEKKDEILENIKRNATVIVYGDTGSGKTTQIPRYIYENELQQSSAVYAADETETAVPVPFVICTQPRRIAAVSVAERVAAERGEQVGDVVGYHIRLDCRRSERTRLLYVTNGILLQYLQNDAILESVTHIVLDEVHERQVEMDFLMTILRMKLAKYPHLKLVLMSATIDSDLLARYFSCPIVSVSGRTYPVQLHYIDEVHKLVRQTQLKHPSKRSDIISTPQMKLADAGDENRTEHENEKSGKKGSVISMRVSQRETERDAINCKSSHAISLGYNASENAVQTPSKGYPHWSKKQSKTEDTFKSSGNGSANKKKNAQTPPNLRCSPSAEVTSPSLPSAPSGEREGNLQLQMRRPQKLNADMISEIVVRIIQSYSSREVSRRKDPISQSILVFCSGLQIINDINKALRMRNVNSLGAEVLILHSSLEPQQQHRVFKPAKFFGDHIHWKVILSTNIAETSITIDDVTHVIDTGYVKQIAFDPELGYSSLKEKFICRASAKQRCGRAGRVQEGHCWRLYSEDWLLGKAPAVETTVDSQTPEKIVTSEVSEFDTPEIKRVCLDELILTVLLYEHLSDGNPQQFLHQCPEPPDDAMIESSIRKLLNLNAIAVTKSNLSSHTNQSSIEPRRYVLTPLGYHLAQLPVDVSMGKMLIMSCILGCTEPILTIASMLSGKSPFLNPANKQQEAYNAHCYFTARERSDSSTTNVNELESNEEKHAFAGALGKGRKQKQSKFSSKSKFDSDSSFRHQSSIFFSDHLSVVRVFDQWTKTCETVGISGAKEFCQKFYLSHSVLSEMRKLRELFRRHLIAANLLTSPSFAYSKRPKLGTGTSADREEDEEDDAEEVLEFDKGRDEAVPVASEINSSVNENQMNNLIRCCLAAGLCMNIAVVEREAAVRKVRGSGRKDYVTPGRVAIRLENDKEAYIHPSSLTHRHFTVLLEEQEQLHRNSAYIVYHKLIQTSKPFLHDCTAVPPIALLLFTHQLQLSFHSKFTNAIINNWIHLPLGRGTTSDLHAMIWKRLHQWIESILVRKINTSSSQLSCAFTVDRQIELLRWIIGLLLTLPSLRY